MFKIIIYYILLFCSTHVFSQSWVNVTSQYINNPSFEEYYTCPQGGSVYPSIMWIDTCKYWYAPTQGTSDYFNVCSNAYTSSIPTNYQGGYQETFHGDAYCGFYAYTNFPLGYIEYIQSHLKEKLHPNTEYLYSMRINKSNVYSYGFENIGANFSKLDMKDYSQVYKQYNFTPTVLNNNGVIVDTINWQLVTGSFTADGDEEYLTIGWFGDSLGEYGLDSGFVYDLYYFVDSLNLYEKEIINECNTNTFKEFEINILTPNNDGINDFIDFELYKLKSLEFTVYNRWGAEVYKTNKNNDIWRAIGDNNKKLFDGVYYYILKGIDSCNKEVQVKNYIQVIN